MQSSPALHYHIPDLPRPPLRDASHCWTWAAWAWQQQQELAAMVSKQPAEAFSKDHDLPLTRCPWPRAPTCSLTPREHQRVLHQRARQKAPPTSWDSGCRWALLQRGQQRAGAHSWRGAAHRADAWSHLPCHVPGTALPAAHLAALPCVTTLREGLASPSQIFW